MITTRSNTYSYSVNHVTDGMINGIKRIVALSDLDLDKFMGEWKSLDNAMKIWLGDRHMKSIILEVYDPKTNILITRWDMDVRYDEIDEDDVRWTDVESIRLAIQEAGIPACTAKYDIIIINHYGRRDVEGWVPATIRSTDGLVRQSIGRTVGANGLGVAAAYWRTKT